MDILKYKVTEYDSSSCVCVCGQMIHLPIYRHARRFLASMVVFGSIVLVMLWLPVQVVRHLFPNFLPFHVMLSRSELGCHV